MAFSVLAEIGHSEQTDLFALLEQPDDKEATNCGGLTSLDPLIACLSCYE